MSIAPIFHAPTPSGGHSCVAGDIKSRAGEEGREGLSKLKIHYGDQPLGPDSNRNSGVLVETPNSAIPQNPWVALHANDSAYRAIVALLTPTGAEKLARELLQWHGSYILVS
jgi:hypothetical protein